MYPTSPRQSLLDEFLTRIETRNNSTNNLNQLGMTHALRLNIYHGQLYWSSFGYVSFSYFVEAFGLFRVGY